MKNHISILIFLALGLFACNNSTPQEGVSEATETTMENAQFGGLALYSLRDSMAVHPREVLKEVADIGYKYIEAANYEDGKFYGMSPTDFKAYLDEIGLIPMSVHQGSVTLDNADQMIADTKAAGFKYFVIPVPPMGHFKFDQATGTLNMSEDLETVMNIINTIGAKCTAAGLQLLYHNHNFEFEENANGIVPMEYFLEHSDSANVNFQMDLYWVTKAGEDPLAWFAKAPGRFKSWHVKDMDDEGRFAPVGTGHIDFARILEHKDESGMECYFVEQDRTFNNTPIEAVTISHNALKEIGFQNVN